MKKQLFWTLALGALQLMTVPSSSRAEELEVFVPYQHYLENQRQVFEVREQYERWGIWVTNTTDVPISNVVITTSGRSQDFLIEPLDCDGATIQPGSGCAFVVQWIVTNYNKKVFNEVVTVSGETPTGDQVATTFFLRAELN